MVSVCNFKPSSLQDIFYSINNGHTEGKIDDIEGYALSSICFWVPIRPIPCGFSSSKKIKILTLNLKKPKR